MKQARGWVLEQVSPGVLTWSTPAGRRYIVTPAQLISQTRPTSAAAERRVLLIVTARKRSVLVARKGRMWLVPRTPPAPGETGKGGAASNAAAAVLGTTACAAAVSQCPQHSRH